MEVFDSINQAVVSEFSDIADIDQTTRIVLRMLMAALLGGMLGLEREWKRKNAGVRTHMLVSMGACLFVIVPQQAGATVEDLSRVLQGLVAGIGFLGAGAIVLGTARGQPKGLTTAAGIWLTAAIGVAAGMGRETLAVLATLIAIVVLAGIPRLLRVFASQDGGRS